MISPILLWFVAFITVIPALSLVFARKPVYIAMAVVLVISPATETPSAIRAMRMA